MIFARIKADSFHACGVFSDQAMAADTLFGAAEVFHGTPSIDRLFYAHKPSSEMSEFELADAGAMVEGAVVVL